MSNTVGYLFNAAVIVAATIVGATFPKVGSILGYVGSFIGLALIYIIPISVYLKRYRLRMEDPDLVKALDENRIETDHGRKNDPASPKIAYDEGTPIKSMPLNSSSITMTIDNMSLHESLLNTGSKPQRIDYKKYYFV
jgi:hypothetical protein